MSGAAVALALTSAAVVHQQTEERRTELAVSGPVSASVPVRLTSSVVVELIRSARTALLVVSFAAYGVPEVVAELLAASGRGVRIDLVLESSSVDGGALRGVTGASAASPGFRIGQPSGTGPPRAARPRETPRPPCTRRSSQQIDGQR
ncbi:hypothetical protein O7626_03880 [Micromonospora sp. WMMD1102]|uniref:hypothetical protein n=1 Tax=Micromonospora sp. WMMD1102 TaxID=3016105 RepID=UPI00241515EA|nr:hypothetical protein [Micromonospora sp. WMMD1102]MDG4785078.1 hypothetical protein [Micromonospora sp. WMMD1102]